MLNFINSIPTSIGWVLVDILGTVTAFVLVDIGKMVVIAISSRFKEETEEVKSVTCPECGGKEIQLYCHSYDDVWEKE